MLHFAGLFFLVIAVSLDGFTVGLAYGMQQIRIPLTSLTIIMALSGSIVLLSMSLGSLLSPFISPTVTGKIGGIILIILGLFSLYNVLNKKDNENNNYKHNNMLIHIMRMILFIYENVALYRSDNITFK